MTEDRGDIIRIMCPNLGCQRILAVPPTRTDRVRVVFERAKGPLCVRRIWPPWSRGTVGPSPWRRWLRQLGRW